MRIGVIGVQGDVAEHEAAMASALAAMGHQGQVVVVRRPGDLDGLGALAIPGGESTTISRMMNARGLFDRARDAIADGLPVMGTCAGCVLLASQGDRQVERTGTRLMEVMDMAVDRNAFGGQRESFEAVLNVEGFDSPYPCVFIRAPAISRTWGACRTLASFNGAVVMAAQDNMLAMSFHPELTGDTRVHEMFISWI